MELPDDATIQKNRKERLASIPVVNIVARTLDMVNLKTWRDARVKPSIVAAMLLETAANSEPDNKSVVWLRDFFRDEKDVVEEYERMRAENRQEAALIDLYARYRMLESQAKEEREKCFSLFLEAATLGYAPSMAHIGFMHENPPAQPFQPELQSEALKWYSRAAEMGEPQALLEMSRFTSKPEDREKTVQKALATRFPFKGFTIAWVECELSEAEQLEREADIFFDETALYLNPSVRPVVNLLRGCLMNKDNYWPDSLRYLIGKIFEQFRAYGVKSAKEYFQADDEWPLFMQEHEWYSKRVATFRTAALTFLLVWRHIHPPIPRDVALLISKRAFAARKAP